MSVPVPKPVVAKGARASRPEAGAAATPAATLPPPPQEEIDFRTVEHNMNFFNRSSRFNGIRAGFREQKHRSKFIQMVTPVVQSLDSTQGVAGADNRLEMIFTFVLQAAEDYLYDPEIRDGACMEILLPYVNNNEEFCRSYMIAMKRLIKKNTWFRHSKRALRNFFLRIPTIL